MLPLPVPCDTPVGHSSGDNSPMEPQYQHPASSCSVSSAGATAPSPPAAAVNTPTATAATGHEVAAGGSQVDQPQDDNARCRTSHQGAAATSAAVRCETDAGFSEAPCDPDAAGTARGTATAGAATSSLRGTPVKTPAAQAASCEPSRAADAATDAAAVAQQQAQLFYALLCEEMGDVESDLLWVADMEGLSGAAADAAVQRGMQQTAVGRAATAAALLADINETESDALLARLLSEEDPLGPDLQQVLLGSVL